MTLQLNLEWILTAKNTNNNSVNSVEDENAMMVQSIHVLETLLGKFEEEILYEVAWGMELGSSNGYNIDKRLLMATSSSAPTVS